MAAYLPLLPGIALLVSVVALLITIHKVRRNKRAIAKIKTHLQDLTPEDLIKIHSVHVTYENDPSKEVPDLYDVPLCLECGSRELLEGPSGGISMNMMCARCNNTWNITPLPCGIQIEPIGVTAIRVAERKKNAEQHS